LDGPGDDPCRVEPSKGGRNQAIGVFGLPYTNSDTGYHITNDRELKWRSETECSMLGANTLNRSHPLLSSGSNSYTAESNSLQTGPATNRKTHVTFKSLLSNSFLLIYRPLYLQEASRTMHKDLRSWLPTSRLLSTIEALLVGVGWTARKTAIPHKINRGVIFVSSAEGPAVIEKLRDRCKELKDQGRNMENIAEILLICSDDLAIRDDDSNCESLANIMWSSRYT
jgi:hypothetical protein